MAGPRHGVPRDLDAVGEAAVRRRHAFRRRKAQITDVRSRRLALEARTNRDDPVVVADAVRRIEIHPARACRRSDLDGIFHELRRRTENTVRNRALDRVPRHRDPVRGRAVGRCHVPRHADLAVSGRACARHPLAAVRHGDDPVVVPRAGKRRCVNVRRVRRGRKQRRLAEVVDGRTVDIVANRPIDGAPGDRHVPGGCPRRRRDIPRNARFAHRDRHLEEVMLLVHRNHPRRIGQVRLAHHRVVALRLGVREVRHPRDFDVIAHDRDIGHQLRIGIPGIESRDPGLPKRHPVVTRLCHDLLQRRRRRILVHTPVRAEPFDRHRRVRPFHGHAAQPRRKRELVRADIDDAVLNARVAADVRLARDVPVVAHVDARRIAQQTEVAVRSIHKTRIARETVEGHNSRVNIRIGGCTVPIDYAVVVCAAAPGMSPTASA